MKKTIKLAEITTCSGIKFHPLNFDVSHFNIQDMARSLSNKCRFGGNLQEFYSVAEHSILVADLLERMYPLDYTLQMAGLLHEVDEYVTTIDFPAPIKADFYIQKIPIKDFEKRCKSIMCEALNMKLPMESKDLKLADNILCATESVKLRQIHLPNYPPPQCINILCYAPKEAYTMFLERFQQLNVRIQTNKCQNTRTKRIRKKSSRV